MRRLFIVFLSFTALAFGQNEPTSTQDYAELNGVRFDFAAYDGTAATFEVGAFSVTDHEDMHMFVVAPSGIRIVDDLPASASVDGAIANGVMENAYVDAGQGFDEFLDLGTGGAGIETADVPWVPAFNIAPSYTSSDIIVESGEQKTYTKAVRLAGVTDGDQWRTIDKYVHLHVLSSVPPLGAYPPSPSATTKTIWTRDDVDYTVLRNIEFPVSFPSASDAESNVPSDTGLYGVSGETLRRLRLDGVASHYSGSLTSDYAQMVMSLHRDDISTTDRNLIADKVIRFGIQVYGLLERGEIGGLNAGAGQGGCIGMWLPYAAALLQDSDMWTAAKTTETQIFSAQWITESDVGREANGSNGASAQTAFAGHVGVPMVIPDEWGTNWDTRYGSIAARIVAMEAFAIMLLNDGVDDEDGSDLLLNGATVNDTSNDRSAIIAFIDRYRHLTPRINGYSPPSAFVDLYDSSRSSLGPALWTGVPDQIPIEQPGWSTLFAAADGGFSWDYSEYDWASETVTRRDVRYSLDGVQWVEVLDVADPGSVSGLLKGEFHQVGYREVSASGAGVWTFNYPHDQPVGSGTLRNTITTTGTETAAAPTNTVAPQVHARRHPLWDHLTWTPLSGSIPIDDVQLSAGVGYWSGYPAPAYTYQWIRDGVDISGETSSIYIRTAEDAGADLSVEVTATNASGSSAVESAAVTAPALTVDPVGVIIDTEFGGRFPIDYEAEWDGIVMTRATLDHQPNAYGDGAIKVDKTSSFPKIEMPMDTPMVAGQSYRLQAVILADSTWVNSPIRFDFREVGDGASYIGGEFEQNLTGPETITLDYTFDIDAEETSLLGEIYLGNGTASGGSGGGDPWILSLSIVDTDEAPPSPTAPPVRYNAIGGAPVWAY